MHRMIANLVMLAATAVGTLAPAWRAIEIGNWGGGLGALVWPFILAWIATALAYYPLRRRQGYERTPEIGASRTQYVGLAVGLVFIGLLAANFARVGQP